MSVESEKIKEILESYEYDLVNFCVEDHQYIRDRYKGEIDNLWEAVSREICYKILGQGIKERGGD
jgi:hypothetical protein